MHILEGCLFTLYPRNSMHAHISISYLGWCRFAFKCPLPWLNRVLVPRVDFENALYLVLIYNKGIFRLVPSFLIYSPCTRGNRKHHIFRHSLVVGLVDIE